MACSSSVGLVIRCNITPRHSSKVSSEDKLSVVVIGGHGRAHGGRPLRCLRPWLQPITGSDISVSLLELHELHNFRSEISLPVIGCIALRSFGPVTLRSEPSVRYPGCSNPRRFVLGNFRSQDFSFPGTFVPNSDYS